MKILLGVLTFVCLLTSCASQPPERTAHTLKSDGAVPEVQQGLQIKHADLSFTILPKQQSIVGKAVLSLITKQPRQSFGLDLDSFFTIDSIDVNGQRIEPSQYANPQGLLTINTTESLQSEFEVSIAYSGKPRVAIEAPWDGGFVWSKTPQGEDWIATAVQGEGCDLFWPCIDYPIGEPKQLNVHITVPKNLVAASNGVLTQIEDNGETSTYHWQVKSQHNTYGIALNIGPYAVINQPHTSVFGNQYPVIYYHLPTSKNDAEILVEEMHHMLDFFERTIGPYPFAEEKMGVVETPHLGMEHQTINAYGNQYRKDEYGFDWLLHHELAHEWFANQMTNTNAGHMWLHEGFGTYMQPLYAGYLHGNAAEMSYLYGLRSKLNNEYPIVDREPVSVSTIYDGDTGPGIDIYYKGAWVLHTLRHLVGDDVFFAATRELVYGTSTPKPGQFRPRLATTQDFIDSVNRLSGRDYQWFFDVYLYQASLPELVESRSESSVTFAWEVENGRPFPMPLEVAINGNIEVLDLREPVTLPTTPKDIIVADPNSKILKYEEHIQVFQAYQKANKQK